MKIKWDMERKAKYTRVWASWWKSLCTRLYCCSCDYSHYSANRTHVVLHESYVDIVNYWCWRGITSIMLSKRGRALHWSTWRIPWMARRQRSAAHERTVVWDKASCLLFLQDVCIANKEYDLQAIKGRSMPVICVDRWWDGSVCRLGRWRHGAWSPISGWTYPTGFGKVFHLQARRGVDEIRGQQAYI